MVDNKQLTEHEKKVKQETLLQIIFSQFLEHRLAVISAVVLCLMIFFSFIVAPIISWLTGIDASTTDVIHRYAGSSWKHLLGQDELGRDVLMRLLYGGRISLLVGLISACGTAIVGTIIGALAGYYGKMVDSFLMRTTDFFMALPILPLMIVMSAVDDSKVPILSSIPSEYTSLVKIVGIVVMFSWMQAARLVRGCVLSVKEREFVLASRSLGASNTQIIFSHILPNVVSPVIVSATLAVGGVILYEAVLSFLGLGIQPPTPSWGNMLFNARETIYQAPLLAFYPGFMIFITVICFNFLGDGLQDAMDPKAIKR